MRSVSNGVRLTLNVKALRSETKLLCEPDGTLIMQVAAPPVKGKANREIVKWLSKKFRTSSSNVQLVAGFHSKVKVIEVTGMTATEIAVILGIKGKSDARQ
ncbi:MAG: DUF167 domain-containing protein [Candidatus Bathyarchaeia archaeon]